MKRGDRVRTHKGPGTVNYVRMAPPGYTEIEAVSVLLDHKVKPGYEGSLFAAQDVEVIDA